MQKFIGLVISSAALFYAFQFNWKVGCAALVAGIGGVIYGDAD